MKGKILCFLPHVSNRRKLEKLLTKEGWVVEYLEKVQEIFPNMKSPKVQGMIIDPDQLKLKPIEFCNLIQFTFHESRFPMIFQVSEGFFSNASSDVCIRTKTHMRLNMTFIPKSSDWEGLWPMLKEALNKTTPTK